jgi:hypothetical protein
MSGLQWLLKAQPDRRGWTIPGLAPVHSYVAAATVLYPDREARVESAEVDGDALWLSLSELTAASGWELKAEGVCKDEICVPVPDALLPQLIRKEPSRTLFNLTEFARLIEQPVAHDGSHSVWYFGPAGWEWKTRLASRMAPDFALPDLSGEVRTLEDLRGKKVFLLFWASW